MQIIAKYVHHSVSVKFCLCHLQLNTIWTESLDVSVVYKWDPEQIDDSQVWSRLFQGPDVHNFVNLALLFFRLKSWSTIGGDLFDTIVQA